MKPNHFCHSPNKLLYVTLESSIKDGTCLKSDIEYWISCSMRMASYHRGEWQARISSERKVETLFIENPFWTKDGHPNHFCHNQLLANCVHNILKVSSSSVNHGMGREEWLAILEWHIAMIVSKTGCQWPLLYYMSPSNLGYIMSILPHREWNVFLSKPILDDERNG